jgi:undecaprenyl-diphosphatase
MDYIEFFKAILLGIVQGLTEFLPVSSSGHLLLLESLGIMEASVAFNVFLHFGTLLAVVTVYFKKLTSLLMHPVKNKLWLYAVACVPTCVIAWLFNKYASNLLLGSYLPAFFMLSAVIITSAEYFKKIQTSYISGKSAFVCGLAQGVAVLPAVSRSGATISALMLLGVPKKDAADFSFVLSVPIILLGCGYEALSVTSADFTVSAGATIAGVASAFLSGLLAIKLLLKFVKSKTFYPFAIYLVILSILSFCLL